MKKLLSIFLVSTLFLLSGCSSKAAAASEGAPTGEVPTYLIGKNQDVASAKKALEGAGFEVIGTYEMKKIGTTILFTNDALKKMADQPTRGFAAVLRLFIDEERQQISITNPEYFGGAFMQDGYDPKVSGDALKALQGAFSDLTPSPDKQQFSDLAGYHFMVGMPYYEDMVVVGEGTEADLVKQAADYKKGKLEVFSLQLSENRVLLGYELGSKTSKFVKKIGTQNGAVLPYMILIEDGKAKILSAKYYLAVSYPLLTMGEFMTIATVPGAIETDLAKPFK
jgi:hypothetical protein